MQKKERILELLEELKENNTVVVVEGPKDRAALKKLGITNIRILSRKPLYEIVEKLAVELEVSILTDIDKKGNELYKRLYHDLQRHKVKMNNKLRKFLSTTDLSHIEGLHTFLKNSQHL